MEKQKSKTKKIISIVGEILLWALALFCVSLSIVSVVDSHTNYSCSYLGYRTNVVVSESMANKHPENTYLDDSTMYRINKYDVIFAKEVSYDEINIYDVVLHVESGNLICHRVVDKYTSDGKSYLVTRGDANNLNDAPFDMSLFKGKVINVIPKVGEVVLFLQSGYFFVALFFSIFLVAGTILTISLIKSKKEKQLASTYINKEEAIDATINEENKDNKIEETNDNKDIENKEEK